jgi:GNAT superfamily N-acetyltransferase
LGAEVHGRDAHAAAHQKDLAPGLRESVPQRAQHVQHVSGLPPGEPAGALSLDLVDHGQAVSCHARDGDGAAELVSLAADVEELAGIYEGIVIEKLRLEEKELLKFFLYEAIFIPKGVEAPPREIVEQPELRIYYEDFGTGPADHCLVARAEGRVVGAVWTRIMNDYGHVDDETPSFAISLIPEFRGQGIGTALMREMLSLLKEHGCRQASLAVQKANYAVRMYKNVGFEIIDENDEEYIMVCRL